MAVSPDGQLLISAGSDHRVVLRDAQTLERLLSFPAWTGTVRDLTFDHSGRRVLIVSTDCDVDLWDISALHDGLSELGLAWDRAAANSLSVSGSTPDAEAPAPNVPVIRRPATAVIDPQFPRDPFAPL